MKNIHKPSLRKKILLRIANFVQFYHPAVGGGVKLIRETGRRLIEMGHDVSVYTTDCLDNNSFMSLRHGRHSERVGVWYDGSIRVHSYQPVVLPYLQRHMPVFTFGPLIPQCLLSFLKEELTSQAVVHGMAFPYAHNAFAYLAARLMRPPKKIVFSPWLKENSRIPRYLVKLMKRVDIVIVQSEAERKTVTEIVKDPFKIRRLPAGVGQEFSPSTDGMLEFRTRLGIPTDSRLLLFAGRMTREKGFFDVVKAFKKLPKDFLLLIVGRTDPRAEEFLRKEKETLNGRILISGYVPDQELPDYYNAADLVLYPSSDDSFGMVFLEAMRTGKPVVGCPIGGPKELLRSGWDSEMTPFGEPDILASKILTLFQSVKRLRKMGANGRIRIKLRYDWDKVTGDLADIYESVLDR